MAVPRKSRLVRPFYERLVEASGTEPNPIAAYAFALPIILGPVGLGAWCFAVSPLDRVGFFVWTLRWSLPLGALYIFGALRPHWGRRSFRAHSVPVLAMGLFLVPLLVCMVLAAVNSRMDRSPATAAMAARPGALGWEWPSSVRPQ